MFRGLARKGVDDPLYMLPLIEEWTPAKFIDVDFAPFWTYVWVGDEYAGVVKRIADMEFKHED